MKSHSYRAADEHMAGVDQQPFPTPRDQIAMHVLAGMLNEYSYGWPETAITKAIKGAYRIADAMLDVRAARSKAEGGK